jgi:FlaA1/EpsC-like NDP-sugar epimerase
MNRSLDKMNPSLDGRTVLVTGANGGLGEQFVVQAL